MVAIEDPLDRVRAECERLANGLRRGVAVVAELIKLWGSGLRCKH